MACSLTNILFLVTRAAAVCGISATRRSRWLNRAMNDILEELSAAMVLSPWSQRDFDFHPLGVMHRL